MEEPLFEGVLFLKVKRLNFDLFLEIKKGGKKMNAKEKMKALIKKKKSNDKVKHNTVAKNDRKYMRKAPILNK